MVIQVLNSKLGIYYYIILYFLVLSLISILPGTWRSQKYLIGRCPKMGNLVTLVSRRIW